MLPQIRSRHRDHESFQAGLRSGTIRLVAPIVLVLVTAACGGTAAPDAGSTATSPTVPPTGAGQTGPVELAVTVVTASTTTTTEPTDDWTLGGTVTAQGALAGSFEVFPLCDVRNDVDGEFLNIAFGYQNLDDPIEPTVLVVAHVRDWRDQGEFETTFEAQYRTGTGLEVTFLDAAGIAQITITFIDSIGEADVATITLEGSFAGAVDGTVRADLTCVAG